MSILYCFKCGRLLFPKRTGHTFRMNCRDCHISAYIVWKKSMAGRKRITKRRKVGKGLERI